MTTRRGFLRTATAAAMLAALGDARELYARSLDEHRVATGALPDPDDYLLDPGLRYLNHGSIGTTPRVVHEARQRYLEICESNPWLYMWSEPWVEPFEEVRRRAAALLGCDDREVALTHNTTEGFNLLAHGLPIEAGDEVLCSSLNHPGATNPWRHLAPVRGYRVRQFDFPVADVPTLTADDVVELHLREIGPRTRVLVLPHIDNLVGLRHPIARLASGARERGVEFVAVDGAQSLSMIPVDVRAAGVDFYAASPHKWIQAPKGTGLLYLRSEVQDRVHPMWVSAAQGSMQNSVRRFEDYGTRNRPEILTLGDALAFQARIPEADRVAQHRSVWQRARERVDATPGLHWRSPTQWELSGSLFTVAAEGRASTDLSRELFQDHGLVFRPIPLVDGARLSPNLQTPFEHLEAWFRLAGG